MRKVARVIDKVEAAANADRVDEVTRAEGVRAKGETGCTVACTGTAVVLLACVCCTPARVKWGASQTEAAAPRIGKTNQP